MQVTKNMKRKGRGFPRGSARGAGVALAALAGVLAIGGVAIVPPARPGGGGGPARSEAATV
ncbi:MAG: hypothetical protein H7Y88_04780, partial [Phycisphaerales bacterium]|nr:hypothetical protein [Phycisphaerales bacterium]